MLLASHFCHHAWMIATALNANIMTADWKRVLKWGFRETRREELEEWVFSQRYRN